MTFMAVILLFIFFVLFFLYFWGLNPQMVTIFYLPEQSLTHPAAIIVIGCILVGLILGFGAHIYSTAIQWMRHWNRERSEKKQQEISVIYREGVGRLLSGDLKKARVLLKKALDRDPRRVDTLIALASLNSQEGNHAEGLELLRKAREIEPKSMEVLFKTAAIQEEIGDDEEAIATYQSLIALEKGNRKALRNLRDLYIKHNRWQEALESQRQVLKAGPGTNRVTEEKEMLLHLRYELARQAISNGSPAEAKSELKDILNQKADFTPAQVSLGDAYVAMNHGDDAVKTWQEGYRKQGKGVFLDRLEAYFMKREDPSSLLNFFRSQVLEQGEDLLFRLFYGKLCLRLEMIDEAKEQLQAVESSGVESSQLHLLLAETYRRCRESEQAINEYQKALGISRRLHLNFVCEECQHITPEWNSRCPSCGKWNTTSLVDRKLIQNARPLSLDKMIIHHGEQKEWQGA
ncbi:MAG: tetratricopeptide repeat protein [Desulfuromonadales bacterium]|nr:tetratricopeptide repeat protein [Desulfuromonadales bacterium]